MTWGGRCPACGEPFTGLADGERMGMHKTPYFLPFSNRRERCRFSRGTREDAKRGITPERRATIERIRATPAEQRPDYDRSTLAKFEEKYGADA